MNELIKMCLLHLETIRHSDTDTLKILKHVELDIMLELNTVH